MDGYKQMNGHITFFHWAAGGVWVGYGAVIYLFENILHDRQIEVPQNILLFLAFGFAIFGGTLSYAIFVRDKHVQWAWGEFATQVGLSVFVTLVLGLFLSGVISTNYWLAAILLGAFFKDLFVIAFRRGLKDKVESYLHKTKE